MRDRVFYTICFGFIFGVLLRSFIFVNLYFVVLIGILSVALLIFFILISKNNWGLLIFVFTLALSAGIIRFHMNDNPAPQVFEARVGMESTFSGRVVDEPDKRENTQKLTIEINEGLAKTKILATVNFDTNYKYGDEVSVRGKLQKPENFVTDQGKDFDYINFLKKDGIFYIVNYAEVEVFSHGNGNKIKSALFYIKDIFLSKINSAIYHPESLLMGGLILGERSSFDADMRQKFIDTGTIHIVALSGYNVTIVAEWIMKMFAFLPRNLGFTAGILGILLFVIMTGGQSTAVRAGVMASLAIVARATGRIYDVGRALILAGVMMIVFNPFVLAYDVSFQLSFVATVAVIFLVPKLEKYFLWLTPKFGLRDVAVVTFCAYIFVLPFILYKMGNLSIVAFPANVMILPFIPITMIFGFLTGFAGMISYLLAVPLGYISYLLLHYELGVIDVLSRVPLASFYVPNFPLFLTLAIYAYYIYWLFGANIKNFFVIR
jgi:competence protein ComEC